jgi:hypothetical protein
VNKIVHVILALVAVLFFAIGLRWIFDPAGAAAALGMTLLDEAGRGSQIADIGALFLSMGIMMAIGLIKRQGTWFYAVAITLLLVAILRVVAWQFHQATITPEFIALEVVVGGLLIFAAKKLSNKDSQ